MLQKRILPQCCEIVKIFESQGPLGHQTIEKMFSVFREYDDFQIKGHLRSGPLTKCIFYGAS